jgi:uncharacterized NAD(P)/FAD-binding protein YdhS
MHVKRPVLRCHPFESLYGRARMSDRATKTIAVVGGGLSGALFALKMAQARPRWTVTVIDERPKLGLGVAYGACAPHHLLNVPASRMEVGLLPSFQDWLHRHPEETAEAVAESGGDLSAAFLPRVLFGGYLSEHLSETVNYTAPAGLRHARGRAVGLASDKERCIILEDGRRVPADIVVLAMGNQAPVPPGGPDQWFYDTPVFIGDPWQRGALDALPSNAPLLVIGTGLTMVDIALRLKRAGHAGPILAVSRRGLVPLAHRAGGAWPPFLDAGQPMGPAKLMTRIRAEIAKAENAGVPWQRVFDAARPAVATIWSSWSPEQKRIFLRHGRARWDVHRHRIAPRVAAALAAMLTSGQLEIAAGRLGGYELGGAGVTATLARRGGGKRTFEAAAVINCSGPGTNLDRVALPLLSDLKGRGLAMGDSLGLGLETKGSAVSDIYGVASDWLFALGPLTRPAWWEITAVPEIAIQVDRLVSRLTTGVKALAERGSAAREFQDLGAGI